MHTHTALLGRTGSVLEQVATGVVLISFSVIVHADAAADVDVAGIRDDHRALYRCHPFEVAERLHIPVQRVQHEEVAAMSAGRAIDRAVGSNSKRVHCTLAAGDDVHRRIAEVARIDAHLIDHGVVELRVPLSSRQARCRSESAGSENLASVHHLPPGL
jgi:hypothetical protein